MLCFHVVIAKVIFDHDAGGDDELSLKKGELVEVLDQLEDAGWWKGLLNGKVGLFPSNYVKLGKSTIIFKGAVYMSLANPDNRTDLFD